MLPERRHVLNLCADRYRFAVALGAALVRGQVSLLPPNQTLDLMERLTFRYPGLYCLVDQVAQGGQPQCSLETVVVPESAEPGRAAVAVPVLPETQAGGFAFSSRCTPGAPPPPTSWSARLLGAPGASQ